ncbi:calcium/sodium antiporter [Spartinivicinus poritis]|uniref:Calcium/sodium antiporter n=1 Tax=Spartinivicinus poritis TaxID=2994640 RepID=A0ABT5UI80_9GAMM|nr:calcium/sodium antiporter [Spartinivicinus sp. A2-2]MDE1465691.1 calcium/sodium antiporter [Spartinivicinus sp. A2-2]
MILYSLAVIVGIGLLVWSADRFVISSASIAHRFNVSPLVIGLTIVSIGTSAPEIVVSAVAGLTGSGSLAIGNALGSNIANIGLVLGITALVAPIAIDRSLVKRELPMLFIVTLVIGYLLYDLKLTLIDSFILLFFLILTLYLLFYKNSDSSLSEESDIASEDINHSPMWKITGWFVFALIVLLSSAKILVWGATNIASSLGVSELVIGLTIVAIGTSLPELAASITSAVKGHHGMAIGNIIGSNLFNLLAVLPIPGLIATTWIESTVLVRDYSILLISTIILFLIVGFVKRQTSLSRFAGCFLVIGYSSYLIWIYQANQLA